MEPPPQYQGYRPSVDGDYCSIWDIENYELADLELLKRVDEKLLAGGYPHLMDILDLESIVDALQVQKDPIQALLSAVLSSLKKDWKISDFETLGGARGAPELFELFKKLSGTLQSVNKPGPKGA